MGGPVDRSRARAGADGAVLHDHAAAGRIDRRVHPDAARSRRGGATTWRRGWSHAATANNTVSCSSSSFPKQTLVFGPRQVVGRINQDQVISPQITLWNQQGSEVIQGTLMVIPIEESLLYIRPLYLRAQAGRIPELTRVIVALQRPDRDGAHARGRPGAHLRQAQLLQPRPRLARRPRPLAATAENHAGARHGHDAGRHRPGVRSPSRIRTRHRRTEGRRLGEIRRGNQTPRRNSREDEIDRECGVRNPTCEVRPKCGVRSASEVRSAKCEVRSGPKSDVRSPPTPKCETPVRAVHADDRTSDLALTSHVGAHFAVRRTSHSERTSHSALRTDFARRTSHFAL